MAHQHPQLLLPIGFAGEFSFENFVEGEDSESGRKLQEAVLTHKQSFTYIVGGEDSGKSHLCIALLNDALAKGMNAYSMSCAELLSSMSGEAFRDYSEYLFSYELLIIDGLEEIAGEASYELSLFSLFNHFKEHGQQLVISARDMPNNIGIQLPDLKSRLGSGLTVKVSALSDHAKLNALSQRAEERGIALSEDVINFIILRSSRNMGALLQVLDRIDHASLVEKRSLTVPFVKKILGW